MSELRIKISEVFTAFPGGRYVGDGPYSGERFRNDWLVPALKNNDVVTVELDGTLGYGSSFLEEAFGGLVRESGFSASELKRKLRLSSSRDTLHYTIWQYIADAQAAMGVA